MLPKLNAPVYELTLPLLKQKIKFRPFLVKEQKILLIALQSEDPDFVRENVKQIIKNCCLSEINIDELSALDIEYFFLHLRARSIGEIVETRYKCENKISDDETCKNKLQVNINLLDIAPDLSNYKDTVELTDSIGVKFKYPDFKIIETLNKDGEIVDKTFDAIINCIEYIYDDNNFYYAKESTKQELQEFLESLNVEQFKKIESFFASLPKLRKQIDVKCNKCGFDHKIVLEGIDNFLE